MKITVSELIVKYMERLGIDYIFGMPGAHILPVYDSLYNSRIQSVLAKHEQGASFMACGHAKASGKISACITTAGPGATNLVTGVANAYVDKQPILIITGETSTHIFGKGGLQESSGEGGSIDQQYLFKGITKYNKIIERTDYLANVLNKASKILLSDNSGPVLLSFPFNVQKEMVDDALLDEIKTVEKKYGNYKDSLQVKAIADLLIDSKAPVIVAGYGSIKSTAQDVISRLSETLNIPVTSSLKGKGVISEQSELSLGSLGVTSYGHAYKYIVEQADVVLFLGASFNERTSYLWDKELLNNKIIIQIDNDQEQLEKAFKAEVAINGDIKDVITGVLLDLENNGAKRKVFEGIKQEHEVEKNDTSETDSTIFQSKFSLIRKLFSMLEKNIEADIQVFDDNIIFAQNFYTVSSSDRYYPNSGVSSLGHAIPAAIGAGFSEKKPTFAILGDGGFQMCCMEIMTAVNYNIPLNIIMFNNSTMGLIRKNQFQQYEKRFIDCDFTNPDYEYLSKSFGINYTKIVSESDLDKLFVDCDFSDSINLIELIIDKDDFPNYISKR
jgi:acetolactate synthase I/II/III large subunit